MVVRVNSRPPFVCNDFSQSWRNGRRSGLKIRRPRGHEGSSPSVGTNYHAPVAQPVEQRTFNPWVAGSIPAWCTNARVAKMVYAEDLKSSGRKAVRVRVPPLAQIQLLTSNFKMSLCIMAVHQNLDLRVGVRFPEGQPRMPSFFIYTLDNKNVNEYFLRK